MEAITLPLNQQFNGFYFHAPMRDYFFITSKTRKTSSLVKAIDEILSNDGCKFRGMFGTFALSEMLQKSVAERKECSHGCYYSFTGDGFCFGDLEKNRTTKVFKLD